MNINRTANNMLFGIFAALALTSAAWAIECGDTAGLGGTDVPCSCGDTVVTSTTLIPPNVDPINGDPVISTADADVCAGDGLIVAPRSLARLNLSLGNNAIRGSDAGVGIRVVGTGVRVRIRTGRIRNFDTALTNVGSGTGDAEIVNLIVQNNIDGIDLEGNNHVLDSNQALDNSDTGIRLVGNRNFLLSNASGRSGGAGIEISGDSNVLRKNKVNRSGGNGMRVEGQYNVLDHNLAEKSGLDGIAVIGNGDGNPATIELNSNKATGNGGSGISVLGNNHDFVANQGDSNTDDGILAIGSGNRFRTNVARENRGDGVFVTGGGNVDNGANFGKKNDGVQCQIDGIACIP